MANGNDNANEDKHEKCHLQTYSCCLFAFGGHGVNYESIFRCRVVRELCPGANQGSKLWLHPARTNQRESSVVVAGHGHVLHASEIMIEPVQHLFDEDGTLLAYIVRRVQHDMFFVGWGRAQHAEEWVL